MVRTRTVHEILQFHRNVDVELGRMSYSLIVFGTNIVTIIFISKG